MFAKSPLLALFLLLLRLRGLVAVAVAAAGLTTTTPSPRTLLPTLFELKGWFRARLRLRLLPVVLLF